MVIEAQRAVMQYYYMHEPDSNRKWHGNWHTLLTRAKALPSISEIDGKYKPTRKKGAPKVIFRHDLRSFVKELLGKL